MKQPNSRYVYIELFDGSTGDTKTIYALRGITSIEFSLTNTVGTTQGLVRNVIHPWFFKISDITLRGNAYIGAYKITHDSYITNPSFSVSEVTTTSTPTVISQQKNWLQKKLTDIKTFLTKTGRYLKEEFTGTKSTTSPQQLTYRQTDQIIRFMESLRRISDMSMRGDFRLYQSQYLLQRLVISDYGQISNDTRSNLKFVGFIRSLNIKEESKQLGVLDYTITFAGVPTMVEAVNQGKEQARITKEKLKKESKPIQLSKKTTKNTA